LKELTMKLFGTVKTFDEAKGFGLIKPEIGNQELRFENSAVSWVTQRPRRPNAVCLMKRARTTAGMPAQ
jgi:hypothetical protein